MKKNEKKRQLNLKKFSLIGFSLFLVPVVFALIIMSITRFWDFEGSAGEWLGYWGGIIGSSVGIIGAVLISQNELKKQRENEAQFMIASLYIEKMEEVQIILLECEYIFERLIDEIDTFREDYQFEFEANKQRVEEAINVFNTMKEYKNKLIKIKVYYSYFSGKDIYFIKLLDLYSGVMNKFTLLSLAKEHDYEALDKLLDEYESYFEETQSMVATEITISLIKIQSNYADPTTFVNDYEKYKDLIEK